MTSANDAQRSVHLDAAGDARLAALEAKGWTPPGEHPMAALHGQAIGPLRIVVLLGPKNNVGARYFQLFAVDGGGRLSAGRLALGMFNAGPYPAFNWVELTQYEPVVTFDGEEVDIRDGGDDLALFQALASLVPPGGHVMVEYDSPFHEATARMLALGYPPATTPLGYRLFQSGVRSYRDWYIPEGGREGPRKLQGFKPLNEEVSREKTAVLLVEVKAVLESGESHGKWGEIARRNATAVVQALNVA